MKVGRSGLESEFVAVTTRSQAIGSDTTVVHSSGDSEALGAQVDSDRVADSDKPLEPLESDQVDSDRVAETDQADSEGLQRELADDIFEGGREKTRRTRSQKRVVRHKHAAGNPKG